MVSKTSVNAERAGEAFSGMVPILPTMMNGVAMEKKYSIGQTIIYSQSGICSVEAITENEFYGERTEYYVLRPLYDAGSLIYVPIENETLVSRIRSAMTKDEVDGILDYMPNAENIWIDNDNKRREAYSEILLANEPRRMTEMIKTLRSRREEQISKKKRLHISDEHLLERAQRILCDEISYVLGVDRNAIDSYIVGHIEKIEKKDA